MKPATHDQSLLGRVFDQYQNFMLISQCVREASRQLKSVNPKVLELSRRPLGVAEYIPEAELVRYPTHINDQPVLPSPLTLPFADRAFDCCLVSDAYEHLPSERRPELLAEMVRVTRGLVLVGCPVRSELTTRFDRIVFDFIWGKYGESFEPLRQHNEFGLETLEEIVTSIKTQGASRVIALPSNYVYRWIHQILIYFDLQHRQPYWDLFEPLDRIYNERLSPYDYREPAYHYLMVVAVDPGLDLDAFERRMKAPRESPAHVRETEGILLREFAAIQCRADEALRERGKDIVRLEESLYASRREIEELTNVISQIQQGRWFRLRRLLSRFLGY